MVGSIGVTEAGCRGGCTDGYISAGWFWETARSSFCQRREQRAQKRSRFLQTDSERQPFSLSPLAAAEPKQDQKHEPSLLHRETVDVLFLLYQSGNLLHY